MAAPRERLLRRGAYDYLVSLSRSGWRDRCAAWAIPLRQCLPRVRVPLAHADPDIVLDLQAVFDHIYDDGAFARQVDYTREPGVTSAPADATWADALLRERGLRP